MKKDLSQLDTSHLTHLTIVGEGGIMIEEMKVEIDSLYLDSKSKIAQQLKQKVAEGLEQKPATDTSQPQNKAQGVDLNQIELLLQRLPITDRISLFAMAIRDTYTSKLIKYGQDYGALFQLICKDRSWLPRVSSKEFFMLLKKNCCIPQEDLPSESTIRVLCFGNSHYPNWIINNLNAKKTRSLNTMIDFFLHDLEKLLKQ